MKVSEQAVGECKDKAERDEKKIKQREVFSKYGLDESVDDLYPFELSGGMARKVLLSTALLNDPDLLIADEPTPGLDVKSVEETIQDIRSLKDHGKGVQYRCRFYRERGRSGAGRCYAGSSRLRTFRIRRRSSIQDR